MVGNIILYFVVALAMVIFSVMAVTSKKILRSATYLLFVLIGAAIFYFQLGYEFLGAIQIAVYAGGIMVLFVFAILLTHKPNANAEPVTSHRRVAGVIASVVGCGLLLWAMFTMPMLSTADGVRSLSQALADGPDISMKMIGQAFTGTDKYQYLLPFEAVSVLLLACIIGGVTVARKR
ncbi:MAG: NADH-quinone oxidoreductase subunit J [Muribaculaceae bacterium]|nr:NADH-quinone oxidoreductase subunit J [Bacteroidales bacterium]MDE6234424.1 NADH-quinone oxidoreductase subunit J [Muribaculaceae bacterium]